MMKFIRIFLVVMMTGASAIASTLPECDLKNVTISEEHSFTGDTFYVNVNNTYANRKCIGNLFLENKGVKIKGVETPQALWIHKECQFIEDKKKQLECSAKKKCQRASRIEKDNCVRESLCLHDLSIKSKQYIADTLKNHAVDLKNCEQSRYSKKIICDVIVDNSKVLSTMIIENGHGVKFSKDTKPKFNACKR
jgi:hypothetical protein